MGTGAVLCQENVEEGNNKNEEGEGGEGGLKGGEARREGRREGESAVNLHILTMTWHLACLHTRLVDA